MEFTATQAGFEDGMGGASEAAGTADYHYVLFGRQTDQEHPPNNGVYFEFDDQSHGAVDCVSRIIVAANLVSFELKDGPKIVVRRGTTEPQWTEFLKGIHDTFGHDIVHMG